MIEPEFIPTPEYIAADRDYGIAQENYVKVAELYRTMMADDSEFLAARHWRDACLEAFDAAEADALKRQPYTKERPDLIAEVFQPLTKTGLVTKMPDGSYRGNPTVEFNIELTPEGEQSVIPGCERQTTPKNPQGELFS